MKKIYIYPGTFCPPHYGHVALAKEAARTFGKVTVVCSVNPVKKEKDVFAPQECEKLWQTYRLGRGIKVTTLDEFLRKLNKKDTVVMIRGIRDNNDIIYENDVMIYDRDHYGVTHYHYIIGEPAFRGMSSTKARQAARNGDLAALNALVNLEVAQAVLKKYKK